MVSSISPSATISAARPRSDAYASSGLAGPEHRADQVGLDHRAAPHVSEPLVDRPCLLKQLDGLLRVARSHLERAEVGKRVRLPALIADLPGDADALPEHRPASIEIAERPVRHPQAAKLHGDSAPVACLPPYLETGVQRIPGFRGLALLQQQDGQPVQHRRQLRPALGGRDGDCPSLPAVPLSRVAEGVPEPAHGLAEPEPERHPLGRPVARGVRWLQAPAERYPDVVQLGLHAVAGGQRLRPLQMRHERFGEVRIKRRMRVSHLVEFPGLRQPRQRECPHRLQHPGARLAVRAVPDRHQAGVGKLRDTFERIHFAGRHRGHGRQLAASRRMRPSAGRTPGGRAQQVIAPADRVAKRPLAGRAAGLARLELQAAVEAGRAAPAG